MSWLVLGSLSTVQSSPSLRPRTGSLGLNRFPTFAEAIRKSRLSHQAVLSSQMRGGDASDVEAEAKVLGDMLDGTAYDEEYELEDFDEYDTDNMDKLDIDEPYFLPPSTQLYATFACMLLSRRLNFFDPSVVRVIRFSFVAFIVIQQLFVFFIRFSARKNNDLTMVQANNALPDLIASQMRLEGSAHTMLKKLTSSFLSSETTVMEYDLKQASDMQGAVLMNLFFMWFLHFRLEKVQPLVIQIMTGFMQLIYSPLFQVYVLGKNLQRPFKTSSIAVTANNQCDQSEQITTPVKSESYNLSSAYGKAATST